MLAANPYFSGYEDHAQGFGELKDERLTIHWVDTNDGKVTIEVRELVKNGKHTGKLGLIRN